MSVARRTVSDTRCSAQNSTARVTSAQNSVRRAVSNTRFSNSAQISARAVSATRDSAQNSAALMRALRFVSSSARVCAARALRFASSSA